MVRANLLTVLFTLIFAFIVNYSSASYVRKPPGRTRPTTADLQALERLSRQVSRNVGPMEYGFVKEDYDKAFRYVLRNICENGARECLSIHRFNFNDTSNAIPKTIYFENRGSDFETKLPGDQRAAISLSERTRSSHESALGDRLHRYVETRPIWRMGQLAPHYNRSNILRRYRVVFDVVSHHVYLTEDHYHRFVPYSKATKQLFNVMPYFAHFTPLNTPLKAPRSTLKQWKDAYRQNVFDGLYRLNVLYEKLAINIRRDRINLLCSPKTLPSLRDVQQFSNQFSQLIGCRSPIYVFPGGRQLSRTQLERYLTRFQLRSALTSLPDSLGLTVTSTGLTFSSRFRVGVTEHMVAGNVPHVNSHASPSNANLDGLFLVLWSDASIDAKDAGSADVIGIFYYGFQSYYTWNYWPLRTVNQDDRSVHSRTPEWISNLSDQRTFSAPIMARLFASYKESLLAIWQNVSTVPLLDKSISIVDLYQPS